MATIYPFSIYTSQGQVYPSSGDNSLMLNLDYLGYMPSVISQQLEGIKTLLELKTFNLPESEHPIVIFPDISKIDISDWNKSKLNLYGQENTVFPNPSSINLDEFGEIDVSCFHNCNALKNIEFTGSCPIDFGEAVVPTGYCYLYDTFSRCFSLETIKGLDLSDYSAICYKDAFDDCWNLTSFEDCFFPTSLYGDNSNGFRGCRSLTALPQIRNTTNVTNFSYTFDNVEISSYSNTFDLSNCTNTAGMFCYNKNLTTMPTITNMTENITDISSMYEAVGEWVWDSYRDSGQEYTPTQSVTVKFANGANAYNAFRNCCLLNSIIVDTNNMPINGFIHPTWVYREWLKQLTIYVPSAKVQDWITYLKAECEGDSELEAIVENMVQPIS